MYNINIYRTLHRSGLRPIVNFETNNYSLYMDLHISLITIICFFSTIKLNSKVCVYKKVASTPAPFNLSRLFLKSRPKKPCCGYVSRHN